MSYRYTLEKYRSACTRHTCPACEHQGEFARYIDTEMGGYLADTVGRCNREVNCGYHYKPKQYFMDNGMAAHKKHHPRTPEVLQPSPPPKPTSYIPFEAFRRSLSSYKNNAFVWYLHNLFDSDTADELIERFYIGTSLYWAGATVFWQIDTKGRVRSGKVMLYYPATGKRVKVNLTQKSGQIDKTP